MAIAGSGGAYYRSGSTIPSSVGLHNAYTRHLFVRSSAAVSAAYKVAAEMVGGSQNPHEQVSWDGSGSDAGAHYHRRAGGAYVKASMTPANMTANAWHSVLTTFDGVNVRGFLDGVADGVSAGSAASAVSQVYVDILNSITFPGVDGGAKFNTGMVAELAIWNVMLTAAEIASLSKGFRAPMIRPQSLQFYAPLVRGLQDHKGARTMALQAGSEALFDHPRVFG